MSKLPRVAVVFGGRSSEHAISCVSAGCVLRAIDRSAWDVVPVGITREGRWALAADDPERLQISAGRLPEVPETGTAVVLPPDPTTGGLVLQEPGGLPGALRSVDVVLPLLHGPFGEDGTVQGLLELADVRYVGSGVFASSAAMDKGHMKALLSAAGLEVGPYVVLAPRDWDRDPEAERARARALGLPVFVKPCRAGSSVGITKVTSWDALDAAVEEARRHDPRVIVEAGIVGRELECGVLEGEAGGPAEASVVAEVRVDAAHDFYDFGAKYVDGGATLDVPADLPAEVADEVRRLAVQAFDALGCEGLARVDFFLADDGRVLVNEVNTMPGFTPASAFPQVWAATGLDYPALVDRLLRTAAARPLGLR
ncbi:D-alanine--D-alanine ligase family protein [Motilibacter aurantiacus]|uniref:D-alanine--D-alanine ligase family protein n=1 Tax=Motilibacter aurantiacus TaxID=2714955 RepID=UPI001408C196|nr:D-alanine--D-alanine ligase family protein [Motilibacter aurantiacus]NHC44662.1 D-alanine--D-alanine ligase [Motilibacter aurantiacus]